MPGTRAVLAMSRRWPSAPREAPTTPPFVLTALPLLASHLFLLRAGD